MKPKEIVLPYLVFHTLYQMSLAFGGIGAGADFKRTEQERDAGVEIENCPWCAHGLLNAAQASAVRVVGNSYANADEPLSKKLRDAGIVRSENDSAVARLVERLFAENEAAVNSLDLKGSGNDNTRVRVSFKDWCAENNVVCGPRDEDAIDEALEDMGFDAEEIEQMGEFVAPAKPVSIFYNAF